VASLQGIGLFDVLYTDFTKLVMGARLVLGHAVGERAVTELTQEA